MSAAFGASQQICDHEPRVGSGHQHDPDLEPGRRSDGPEQDTECHAAERREDRPGGLSHERTVLRPGEREQGRNQQRGQRLGPMRGPPERGGREQRHRH